MLAKNEFNWCIAHFSHDQRAEYRISYAINCISFFYHYLVMIISNKITEVEKRRTSIFRGFVLR